MLNKIKLTLKKITRKLTSAIQKVLITVLLTFFYFVVFGITFIIMYIFKRSILTGHNKDARTSWVQADGYQENLEESLRQS
ncbi:MAG: hypothetical protein RAP41_05595 [Candidatus Orphnella occulta]|nr:hypothetical protein [Candidatus Orphnella occulta]